MQLSKICATLTLVVSGCTGFHLRDPVPKSPNRTHRADSSNHSHEVLNNSTSSSNATVVKLRNNLKSVSEKLETMLDRGTLASAEIAPTMRMFLHELKTALNQSTTAKDATQAMAILMHAQAGINDLTKALTNQQERLMHQGEKEEESLLIGVLMSKKGESMEKQLEVLQSPDFSNLTVSKYLLANHTNAPLFQQAAMYLDHHENSPPSNSTQANKLAKVLHYFQNRLEILENTDQRLQAEHEHRIASIDNLLTSKAVKDGGKLKRIRQRVKHEYRKKHAVMQHQCDLMKDVITALQRGDVKALEQARADMLKSMKNLQERNGNFLHLLQIGHRLMSRDCPYCAAQCIDKCHEANKPYTTCLSECADAGK